MSKPLLVRVSVVRLLRPEFWPMIFYGFALQSVAIIVSLLQEKSDRWQVASFVILCHPEGPLSIWMMPGQFFILLNT